LTRFHRTSDASRRGSPAMAEAPHDPIDRDAAGLPIGVALPERGSFARGQAWAFMMVSLVGAVLLFLWWSWQPHQRYVLCCAIAAALVFAVNTIRWIMLRRDSSSSQART
jgi:hypothetical protein